MNSRRNTWRVVWRLGVCLLLLGWACHSIFLTEARLISSREGADWAELGRLEQ